MIGFEKLLQHSGGQTKQFLVLVRHFFQRLFQNDVVDFEDQMKERTIGILALIAVFSGFLAYALVSKYGWQPDKGTSWIEKCVMIIFSMLVMGFIAVLEWDIILPDERDFTNLIPLPVRTWTLLAAKFTSLCLFVGMFALGINAMSVLAFWAHLPQWQSPSFLYSLFFALAHIITLFLAIFFAFFFNVLLIGILMAVLGYKLFNRISSYIRACLLVIHIFLFLIYLRVIIYGFENLIPLEKIQINQHFLRDFSNFFPPLWFTDLYETLIGNTYLPFHGVYVRALVGLAFMVTAFFLITGLSYSHYLKKMGTKERKKARLQKVRLLFKGLFDGIFLRNPVQRVVFHFYQKTLKASMFHKMRLASFVAVGIGLIPFQIAVKDVVPQTLTGINKTVLSFPLVLSFFLLLGIRGSVNMPVALGANWIFRLTEWEKRRHYFSGIRKAIFFLGLLPLFLIIFVFYLFLWGGITAFYHSLYGLVVSVLVMEFLFLTYCKIPFACSYLPGKEKIQLYWIPYVFIFLAYINLMSWIELQLLRAPSYFFLFYGIVFFMLLGIRVYQVFFFYKKTGIQYEEQLEPVVIALDYRTPPHKRRVA